MIWRLLCLQLMCVSAAGGAASAQTPSAKSEPIASWRENVHVSAVLGDADVHSIHSYFNTTPESPDGRHVLLFRSTVADAHEGDVCIVERTTGKLRVLAAGVTVEDAHRVACQQWVSGGRRVVFHDLRDDEWCVVAVEVESGKERVLAKGRQVAWGQPDADVVPLYGPHWAPGEHRDIELLNVETGEIRTVVTAGDVQQKYPDWIRQQFGEGTISLFFPIVSPDRNRVFFKVASAAGGGFRSPNGSRRYGLIAYDLAAKRFLSMDPRWGHPAWHRDSRHIINIHSQGIVVIDLETGTIERNANLPNFPGAHPSLSPDATLFATDAQIRNPGSPAGTWGVVVGDFATGESVLLHRFDNSQGAATWRGSHPHPIFSSDGRRLYFNVSADHRTRLFVAECAATVD